MESTEYTLSPPSLEELAEALRSALPSNYAESSATVVDCPDLREPPFNLASEGLGGTEVTAEIGGHNNLYPRPRLDKQYSLWKTAELMKLPAEHGFLLGAGANSANQMAEIAINLGWDGDITNLTQAARVVDQSQAKCSTISNTDVSLLANLYGSLGQRGRVLKLTAKGRKGEEGSFTNFVRQSLKDAFGERQISLGGAFIMKQGSAHFHVMPNSLPTEFPDVPTFREWLTWHDFPAPMTCLTVIHSADPEDIGIRLEHTHCFSDHGGGHYHYDQGGDVEYEGYFNTAKVYYQIAKPDGKSENKPM